MAYRSKSSERVLEEFRRLASDYPQTREVFVVDNILDMDYFANVLPALAQEKLGLSISYEVKANLRKEQMRLLKAAGIHHIQPGIESLDSEVLGLMRKGCTGAQNIQLLKWARQYSQRVDWNMLAGFPGEPAEAYRRMAEMLPALAHLQPPSSAGVSWLRIDRFSPYFENAETYGLRGLHPTPAYRYVYPFDDEALTNLAYYFDYDHPDDAELSLYIEDLTQAIERWHRQGQTAVLNSLQRNEQLVLYDTRPGATQPEVVLEGLAKLVYEYCDEARNLASIQRYLNGLGLTLVDIEQTLAELLGKRLMILIDNRYLSLAVPVDEQAQALVASLFASVLAAGQA